MDRYERLKTDLETRGWGWMKTSGNSMLPILSNPSTLLFVKQDTYTVGDIVFSRVRGRYIDAHQITKVDPDGRFMISNNNGHDNGWASAVYGKVVVGLADSHQVHYTAK